MLTRKWVAPATYVHTTGSSPEHDPQVATTAPDEDNLPVAALPRITPTLGDAAVFWPASSLLEGGPKVDLLVKRFGHSPSAR